MFKWWFVFSVILCTIYLFNGKIWKTYIYRKFEHVWNDLTATPCSLRKFPNGFVCVCNETYCDELDHLAAEDSNIVIVSSSKVTLQEIYYFHRI